MEIGSGSTSSNLNSNLSGASGTSGMSGTNAMSGLSAPPAGTPRCQFEHPLTGRYASQEMSYIWSPLKKFSTWRRLWLALAEAQRELGLQISQQQVDSMRDHVMDIDFELAARKESEVRHDVMAHVHAFGQCCPEAMPIIHLGATSCFVGEQLVGLCAVSRMI
jgi:hypothetical protein